MGRSIGNYLIGIHGHGMVTGECPIRILKIKKGYKNTMHVISKVIFNNNKNDSTYKLFMVLFCKSS